jgi:hypothetical protein
MPSSIGKTGIRQAKGYSVTIPKLTQSQALNHPLDRQGFPVDPGLPRVKNHDGSISTEKTITVGLDKKFYNIPTIIKGKYVSKKEAIMSAKRHLKGGTIYPNFDTLDRALAAASDRSKFKGGD